MWTGKEAAEACVNLLSQQSSGCTEELPSSQLVKKFSSAKEHEGYVPCSLHAHIQALFRANLILFLPSHPICLIPLLLFRPS